MEDKKDSYLKVTMQETSSSESTRESSSCCKDSDSSSDAEETSLNICMSPPNNSRMLKKETKSRPKRSRSHKSRQRHLSKSIRAGKNSEKRPVLVNSAENIKENESTLVDLLVKHEDTNSKSAPDTSDLSEHSKLNWPCLLNQANNLVNSSFNQTVHTKKLVSKKTVFECRVKKANVDLDPFDRADSINKISLLLKLALSAGKHKDIKLGIPAPPPPTTPSTSLTANNSFSQAFKMNINNASYSTQTSYAMKQHSTTTSYTPSSSSSQSACLQEIDLNRQQEKYQQSESVWKEIFDFFEYYNDRATPDSIELIDKRLSEARSAIPLTIKEIMNTNFQQITTNMNNDIKEKMKTPLSYLNLYEQEIYIDQLCYLYWLVEDVINRVSYVETLYPSLRMMKVKETSYADPDFEAINKTLLLWYKIMTELMTKCDTLGKFLGFAKKYENLPYWNWFDNKLRDSRKEFENVNRWLKQNFTTKQNSGLTSRSQSRSLVSSPVIDLNRPVFPQTSPIQLTNKIKQQVRQISYELNASKKPLHIYDNSSQSIISDLGDKNDSRRGSTNHLSADIKKKLNPNALTPDVLNEFLNRNHNEKNHLEPVKLHHMTSFLSQNSLISNDADGNPLTSKFYLSLTHNSKVNKNEDSAVDVSTVGFNLNDTALEVEDLKLNVEDFDKQNEEEHENERPPTPEISVSVCKRQKIFKEFLHKRLRKHGLTKTFDEIRKIVLNTLPQALQTLQIDYCEYYNPTAANNNPSNYHLMPLHKKYLEYMDMFPFDEETLHYGVRSQWFQKLNLPSFRPIFLYLNNIILELMHVCIKMQIEGKRDMKKQSNFKFSLLSIEVLTHELRECIEQAILVRQFYYNMVYSVFDKSEMDSQQQLENDLVAFDDDLKLIINIYLSFVTDWVHDLVACSDTFKAIGVLQDEWYFCKNNLYFVTASEDIYAKRFCALCKTVISSLGDSLHDLDSKHKQPLMEYIADLEINQEMNSLDLGDEDSQLNSIVSENITLNNDEKTEINDEEKKKETENNDNNHDDDEEDEDDDEDEEDDEEIEEEEVIAHNRYIHLDPGAYDINLKCNEFKEEVNQIRKRCMKALGFCSNLINDLSLAAKYIVKSKIQVLLNELKNTNHVLVVFTNPELQSSQKIGSASTSEQSKENHQSDLSFMIFVPQEFSKDKIQIARLLFLISAKDDYETTELKDKTDSKNFNKNESKTFKNQKFLKSNFRRLSSSNSFLENMNDELHKNSSLLNKLSKIANMSSPTITPRATSPSTTNYKTFSNAYILSPQVNTEGYLLYLQIPNNTNETWEWTGPSIKLYAALPVRRALYQHRNPDTNDEPKKPANLILVVPKPKILVEKKLEVKSKLKFTVSLIKEKTSFHPNIEYAIDEVKESILNLRSESAKSIRSIEKDLKTHYDTPISISRKSPIIYQRYLSEIWRVSYNFGIDLQNECIKFMTQDQARQFSSGISDFCIMWCEYIVDKTERGKGTTVQPWAARKGIQLLQEAFTYSDNLTDTEYVALKNAVERCISHVIGGRNPKHLDSNQSEQLTRSSTQSGINLNKNLPPSKRFAQNCSLGDEKREHNLQDKRYIGKILNSHREQNIITATEVNFRWQLGLKIGEGQYGTVYSCVNLDTGEPMAMKEIPFKSNDIEAIKNIYSEINNLQGVKHPNLVRLYGSELHRKEMLIFMEFCGDQCTLDRISKETSGLPEKIVRGYTKSLLEAVATLHDNQIMHRDIKGSNIFLKAIDPKHPEKIQLKLGDFGCSIKFKDIIGSSPAKATGFMGTFPYMAPEVMTSGGAVNSGYTISADIWSLGCVVIEMFTGKRPWHPLSDENILYKIHIQKPPVLKPPYPTPNTISEEAIHFLDACLEFDPNLRQTADQLLNHPFVKVHEPFNEPTNEYFSL